MTYQTHQGSAKAICDWLPLSVLYSASANAAAAIKPGGVLYILIAERSAGRKMLMRRLRPPWAWILSIGPVERADTQKIVRNFVEQ